MSCLCSIWPDTALRMELVDSCNFSFRRKHFQKRGVCCRGFLLQWMWLQYSGKSRPACSAACSAACPESEFPEDLLSPELSWAAQLWPWRCRLPCLLCEKFVKGKGSLSKLCGDEQWGQPYIATYSLPIVLIHCPVYLQLDARVSKESIST